MPRKGALEKEIADGIVACWRRLLGRGPVEARSFVLQDMVIVRMRGVLTTEESHLITNERGEQLVREMRRLLGEQLQTEASNLIARLTGCQVVSNHSNISPQSGDGVEVYLLNRNLEKFLTG